MQLVVMQRVALGYDAVSCKHLATMQLVVMQPVALGYDAVSCNCSTRLRCS